MLALLRPAAGDRAVAASAAVRHNQSKPRLAHVVALGLGLAAATSVVPMGSPAWATRSATAPRAATSYYMQTTNPRRLYRMGCRMGSSVRHHSQPRDAMVLLDFGRPRHHGRLYGTHLYFGKFARTGYIQHAAEGFAAGYWKCTQGLSSTVRIAVGTSNYGSQVSYAHGREWALMVNRVNATLARRGWEDRIDAVGANDIELSWNGPKVSKAWVRGYDSANQWPYYDYGDAAECPPYGHCAGAWTQEDVWWVSWGAPPAMPLPEIYTKSGSSARQWASLSLYSHKQHGIRMVFQGVLSQHHACRESADPCIGMNNSPPRAWKQLTSLLGRDLRTAVRPRFSLDMSWRHE